MNNAQVSTVKMSLKNVPLLEKVLTFIFILNLLFLIPVLKVRVCPRKYSMSIPLSHALHECSSLGTFSLEGLMRACTLEVWWWQSSAVFQFFFRLAGLLHEGHSEFPGVWRDFKSTMF